MRTVAEPLSDGFRLRFTDDQPQIRLPLIGWVWPIEIESVELNGDTLKLGLNGWDDLELKVNP